MSVNLTIELTGDVSASLQRLRTGIADRSQLNARVAGAAENWIKDYGRATTPDQHATATRLGATPTKHLERAYASIESKSDAAAAYLLVPRASRLRAAFSDYVVRPGSGKKFLTIPACAAAYGKRTGEFPGLVFVLAGKKLTPALAMKSGDTVTIYYWLVKSATIHQDRKLIPFDQLLEDAADVAGEFCRELTGAPTS